MCCGLTGQIKWTHELSIWRARWSRARDCSRFAVIQTRRANVLSPKELSVQLTTSVWHGLEVKSADSSGRDQKTIVAIFICWHAAVLQLAEYTNDVWSHQRVAARNLAASTLDRQWTSHLLTRDATVRYSALQESGRLLTKACNSTMYNIIQIQCQRQLWCYDTVYTHAQYTVVMISQRRVEGGTFSCGHCPFADCFLFSVLRVLNPSDRPALCSAIATSRLSVCLSVSKFSSLYVGARRSTLLSVIPCYDCDIMAHTLNDT